MSATYLAGCFSLTAVAVNYFTQKNNPDRSSILRIFSSLAWANGVTAVAYKIKNAQFVGKELLLIFGTFNVATLVWLKLFEGSRPKNQARSPYIELKQQRFEILNNVTQAVREKLKPGKSWNLTLPMPWSIDSLSWVLRPNLEEGAKIVYLKPDSTNADDLRQLSRLPRGSIVITWGQALLRPPSTLYHIHLTEQGESVECLNSELMITLHQAWAATWPKPEPQFHESAFEILIQHALRKNQYLDYLMLDIASYFKGKTETIKKHAKQEKLIADEAEENDAVAYNRKISYPLFYSETPLFESPKCLRTIVKNDVGLRQQHVSQILKALGNIRAPHACITGMAPAELEYVLSCIPERPVFHFDLRKEDFSNYHLICDYLSYHPKAILYITDPDVLAKVCANPNLIGKASIVTQVSDKNSSNLFKTVYMMPLTEEECLKDIREWAKEYQFEDNVLEVAVAATFLLRDESSGIEFLFIQDLVERSSIGEQPITLKALWETFRELHYGLLHASFEKQLEQLSLEQKASKIKPLWRISLALKKTFKQELVCDPERSLLPPELLRDLNVELEGAEAFATDVGGRVELLAKALRGHYKNALIIALAGVGKTTLVKQAAWMAVHGKFEQGHPLFGKTIYSLSPTSLMAGAQYIGTFEERIEKVFNFLMQDKNAVLFVDEIHLLMGSGASLGNQMGTVAQHLKPFLEESGIMVIGATTQQEYYRWVRWDGAFVRRFNELYLEDVSEEEVVKVLEQYSQSETFRQIKNGLEVSKELLQTVVKEAKQQRSDVGLIDRAKKLLEKKAQDERR